MCSRVLRLMKYFDRKHFSDFKLCNFKMVYPVNSIKSKKTVLFKAEFSILRSISYFLIHFVFFYIHIKATLKQRLITRENFWIDKMETLCPQEMNLKISRYKNQNECSAALNFPRVPLLSQPIHFRV